VPKQGIVPVRARTLDEAVVIVDNTTYNIADLELYDSQGVPRVTISKTVLHGGQQTRGHSHRDDDETYYFVDGDGIMLLNNTAVMVTAGDYIFVEKGVFHKMINTSKDGDLTFICQFPGKAARPAFINK
jgi:mannose-6-phosphate isomerase-like protein (cupin superfamily)